MNHDKAYARGYEEGKAQGYQEGLFDAWEAARRIGSDSRYGLEEMGFKFEPRAARAVGDDPGWYVVQRHSASECIEKIRQYEQEKEEQKQLQVGDEVKLKRCDIYAVYMGGVNGSNECNVYLCFNDGSCGVQSKSEIERKTGRHFPEIAEVLRKMREGQDG